MTTTEKTGRTARDDFARDRTGGDGHPSKYVTSLDPEVRFKQPIGTLLLGSVCLLALVVVAGFLANLTITYRSYREGC